MAKTATLKSLQKQFTENDAKDDLETLNFIAFLASRNNADIGKWDILKAFGTGKESALVRDRSEINKIFFDKLAKTKARNEKGTIKLDDVPELKESIMKCLDSRLKDNIKTKERNIDSYINQIDDYMASVNDLFSKVMRTKSDLEQMSGNNPSGHVMAELDEALKEGYWVNPVIHNGYLYLNTKNAIILKYANPSAGIDVDVNVGQLAVKINLKTFSMMVIPYKDNIRCSNNYFHPHVNAGGNICWGNAADSVKAWSKELKIGNILKLLYSLLSNYNEGNPYISIQRMKSSQNKYGRTSAELRHPDRMNKLKNEEECDGSESFTITFVS